MPGWPNKDSDIFLGGLGDRDWSRLRHQPPVLGIPSHLKEEWKAGLKDSGARQEFVSGAVRDSQQDKGRFDLMPFWPLLAYSSVLGAGAKKYSDRNWQKGMPISRYLESADRHLHKYIEGMRDEPHLWMALWNLAGAVQTQVMVYLGLYPKEFGDTCDCLGAPCDPMGDFERNAVGASGSAPKKESLLSPTTGDCREPDHSNLNRSSPSIRE